MARNYSMKRTAQQRMMHALTEKKRRAEEKERRAFTDETDMRAKVTLTQGELDAWNQIAAGRPMRNSTAVLHAIKMKMEYTMAKPAVKVDADTKVQIEIVNLGEPTAPPAPPYQPGQTPPHPEEKEDPDA